MKKLIFLLVISCFGLSISAAYAQLTINGNIKGADGEPMRKAKVMVRGPNGFKVAKQIGTDGSFELNLPHKGGYYLYVMGVNHKTLTIPVVFEEEKEADLEVRLQRISYNQSPDSVFIIGNFNDFSEKNGLQLMEKQADGMFTKTLNIQSDSITYQLLGVAENEYGSPYPISGTDVEADIDILKKAPWKSGHFATVKHVSDNQLTIEFDVNKLPNTVSKEKIKFSNSTFDEIVSIYRDVESKESKLGLARRNQRGDYSKLLEAFQSEYKTRLESENNKTLRHLMLLRYFDELNPSDSDSALANSIIDEIPATSPFWSLEARSSVGASNIIGYIGWVSNKPEKVDAYINEVIRLHKDPAVRAQFLYRGYLRAKNNKKLMTRYFDDLKSGYSSTEQFEKVRRDFSPNRAIQAGQKIPNFQFTSLSDSSQVFTNENFEGTFLLIDFWGTWCAPCIEEMPYLHKASKKFDEKDLQILSVAFRDTKEKIKKFRDERYPMPWYHTLISEEDYQKVHSKFEITGIPRPILVSPKGFIIALDEEIRGEKLIHKLDRIFE